MEKRSIKRKIKMTQKTRMFKHANGVRHRYFKQFESMSRRVAEKNKKEWRAKHYYVRIVPAKILGVTVHEVYTFRADK